VRNENKKKEQIEDIVANPSLEVSKNVAGKMIDGYKWRMAGIIPSDRARTISKESAVNLKIGAGLRTVKANVVSAQDQGDGSTVFVFECEFLDEEFVRKRVSSVRLLLDDYSGIRVPQSAVAFNEDEERGVYVKVGSKIIFSRVNMLRSEEDFIIVENIKAEGFMRLYDEIVVSGRNLYHGKIVA
jgi:putative membrane fusion protein